MTILKALFHKIHTYTLQSDKNRSFLEMWQKCKKTKKLEKETFQTLVLR